MRRLALKVVEARAGRLGERLCSEAIGIRSGSRYILGALLAIFLPTLSPVALAQLDENCTVSVLNRNVQVNSDGSWVLPNVPANFGQVRARATCVRNGITTSGESALFTLSANGVVNLPDIVLGPVTQIPVSLSIAPGPVSFTAAGETLQLTVTAAYPDGSEGDVTASISGTTYTTSNSALVTVSPDGRLTAVASGTVVIQATHEGAAGLVRAIVALSSADTDADGIPDDVEVASGLNPNDPVDAFEDPDRDGLTNRQELLDFGTDFRKADTDDDGIGDGEEVVPGLDGYVTSPLAADTDGDGIRDALEVATGSDPTDPASFNLGQALASIEVAPQVFALTLNTIIGVASVKLHVTGHLVDGFDLDLTPTGKGTNYSSSDLAVCSFGGQPGEVFAGFDGTCTITVTNSGFSVRSEGLVRTFAPTALSFVSVPGFANNVDVAGDYAYVAAGATGLQIVDVSNRNNPLIVGAIDTPGNANDVKVVGNTVLVADGSAGLRLLDVTIPASPAFLSAVDTPGTAQDVSVVGGLAYVADGTTGLQIIDISNPSTPVIVASMATRGAAKGVDVEIGSPLAVIAEGTTGVEVADISSPSSPSPRGLVVTGDARDVALSGDFAFVADFSNSFTSVALTDPNQPVVRAFTPRSTGGLLMDVALAGSFAFGADVFFVNGVPIINVDSPGSPVPKAILDFRKFRDDNGTGIAVDSTYVYLTADLSITENGSTGNSRLYIGQYLDLPDNAGIPPTVRILTPPSGSTVIEGSTIHVTVDASDDVAVTLVHLLMNASVAATDSSAPYEFAVSVPVGVATLVLGAQALDRGNNVGMAQDVTLNVIPDPLTTVVGLVVNEAGMPVEGAAVSTLGLASTTAADGTFSIPGVPTILGDITVEASATVGGVPLSGSSGQVLVVPGGVTDAGIITLRSLLIIDLDPGTGEQLFTGGPGTGRSIYLTADAAFAITSVGLRMSLVEQSFDVVIYLGQGVSAAPGPILASATATAGGIGLAWNDLPIRFTFEAGQDYIVNWRPSSLNSSWVFQPTPYFNWGNSVFDDVDLGVVTIRDGREGYNASGASNFVAPHMRLAFGLVAAQKVAPPPGAAEPPPEPVGIAGEAPE